MNTRTQAPHLHDAWDTLAGVPFDAIHYHGGQTHPLYALGSSGAYVVPEVIGELREAAAIAEGEGEWSEAESFTIAAKVLDYLDERADVDERDEDERAADVADGLVSVYGIRGAYAEGRAIYVPSP